MGDRTPPFALPAPLVEAAVEPGLVVLNGPAGAGRSTLLRALADAVPGPVFAGGGLASLRSAPGLALNRAIRCRVPDDDVALAVEAVRARVRGGLLLIDDLQWADPLTTAALPLLAAHGTRIVVALRTPHPLEPTVVARLRAAATFWYELPLLSEQAATALVRTVAPALGQAAAAAVVRRGGGLPLTLRVLARRASATADPDPDPDADRAVTATAAGESSTTGSSTTGSPATGTHNVKRTRARRPNRSTGALEHAIAAVLADMPQPARTAIAALGLLGRPTNAALLGPALRPGIEELTAAGLIHTTGELIAPVSPYVAEVAAGVLATEDRRALHRALAARLAANPATAGEAARHLAAVGDHQAAYPLALRAADQARTAGARATALVLAAVLEPADDAVRLRAAVAALAAGRVGHCLRVLRDVRPVAAAARVAVAVARAEAYLQASEPHLALAAVTDAEPDRAALRGTVSTGPGPDTALAAEYDRVRVLAAVTADPAQAGPYAARLDVHADATPAVSGSLAVAKAIAEALTGPRDGPWDVHLVAAANAAAAAGRLLDEWWCGWLLVERLAAEGRLTETAEHSARFADRCRQQAAYSWQTRFLAVGLWAAAVRGDDLDAVVRTAVDLLDRAMPPAARVYLLAAGALALADTGTLAAARARLDADQKAGLVPSTTAGSGARGVADTVLAWVDREVAWLDGQPRRALSATDVGVETAGAAAGADAGADGAADTDLDAGAASGSGRLPAGLNRLTSRWAAHDLGTATDAVPMPGLGSRPDDLPPVKDTLAAWSASDLAGPSERAAAADSFAAAGRLWNGDVIREQVRCLLAAGLLADVPETAVGRLREAERRAADAGLTVLLARIRRALRRYAIPAQATSGGGAGSGGASSGGASSGVRGVGGAELTPREYEVLELVAEGEPARRIATRLGVSKETVETHVRAGMRKLGARTRTEAAARAMAVNVPPAVGGARAHRQPTGRQPTGRQR